MKKYYLVEITNREHLFPAHECYGKYGLMPRKDARNLTREDFEKNGYSSSLGAKSLVGRLKKLFNNEHLSYSLLKISLK